MTGYVGHIEKATLDNSYFRQVLFTGPNSQLVKLYTVYTPPQHPDGTVHKTKAEADAAEAEEHH
jgi:hypothetical protein